MDLDFGELGPLQLTAGGAPLPLGTPKQRAVLAMHDVGGPDRRHRHADRGGRQERAGAVAPGAGPAGRRVSGRQYELLAGATRIGRLTDNDIVLDNPDVSRHHAVIVDTGTSYVITDLHSANGIEVGDRRIRGTAIPDDGDLIRICDYEFVFELRQPV